MSAVLTFKDRDARTVMTLHAYIRPDGRLGAGRLFDPKYLVDDGVAYFVV